jgi:hypothetical protein
MSMVGDILGELSGQLLVQCRPGQAKNAARVASAHGTGLVLTGRRPRPTVEALRTHGFTGPILCDANRYSGRRRALAEVGIHDSWTAEQHDLGLLALSDSGYLAPHDWPGLRHILADAARQPGPTVAMLPLSARWFEHSVDGLAEEIDRHGVPVAVAIEHAKDPFGVRYVVRGFLALRSVSVPVLLLRSDISALGALAHGTHAAAIGTTTRLRRIPPRSRRNAVGFSSLRAFVPRVRRRRADRPGGGAAAGGVGVSPLAVRAADPVVDAARRTVHCGRLAGAVRPRAGGAPPAGDDAAGLVPAGQPGQLDAAAQHGGQQRANAELGPAGALRPQDPGQ